MQSKRILLLFMALLYAFPGDGQDTKGEDLLAKPLTLNYHESRLGDILTDLRERHGFPLTYSSDQLNLDHRVSIHMEAQPRRRILKELCRQAGLKYELNSGQIILKPESIAVNDRADTLTPLAQVIRGIVKDQGSGSPLPGASVILKNHPKGVNTDENGHFTLDNVPLGRHDLEVSFIGYRPVALSGILVTAGKEVWLTIKLSEQVSSLEVVTVTAGSDRQPLNEMASVSARSFSVEETSRYAASVFDPARMALNFAGVTSADDGSNEIVVRGNSPKSLQWRLEGIEITNPNHFGEEGGSGGGVSMISSSMLSNSDFLTGAFPAEYGNALSGVFDLRFRKGNTEKNEYAIMAGALGTEASAEGPFKKGGRSSYLVNYRYSTLSLLDKVGISPFGDDGIPNYQDLAFHLDFPTARSGTFSLFGIGGTASQRIQAERDASEWEELADKFDRKFRYSSGSTGFKHLWLLNDNIYLKNIVSLSGSRITDHADTLNTQFEAGAYGRDAYINSAIRYSGTVNYKAGAGNVLRAGLVISRLGFNLNSRTYKKDIDRLSDFLMTEGDAWHHEVYAQWKHSSGGALSLNTGFHINYFNLSDTWSIEPRFGLGWLLPAGQRLSFGAGIHSRLEPLAYYFAQNEQPDGTIIHSNGELSPTKAVHLVTGYEKTFPGHLLFKTELYYQYLYDVPVSEDPAIHFSTLNAMNAYSIYSRNYRSLVNKGTGINKGIDLSLERPLDKGYYFLVAASLFDSRFRALDGTSFNTAFNSNYSANLVAGKEWGTGRSDKNLLGLNARMMTNGGMRYSPIDLERSRQIDDQVIDQSRVNELRNDPYFRIDLSLTYRINRPGLTHAIFLDIQNILNRSNEYMRFYNVDENDIETIYQAGLIPSIYYRIEF